VTIGAILLVLAAVAGLASNRFGPTDTTEPQAEDDDSGDDDSGDDDSAPFSNLPAAPGGPHD